MNFWKHLQGTGIFIGLLLFAGGAAATSPCPPVPIPSLLSLDRPEWVVAQVTVVEQPSEELPFLDTKVRVDRVFAGYLPSNHIIVDGDPGFLDCLGAHVPNQIIGASFLIGAIGPNADGSYGGPNALNVKWVEEDMIFGEIPEFQQSDESRTLGEFASFVNALTPRFENEIYTLSMEPRLPGPSDAVSLSIRKRFGVYCFTTVNAIAVDRANATIHVSFNSIDDDISPCPVHQSFSISLPPLALPSGQDHYVVRVFREGVSEGANPFQENSLIGEFDYTLRTDPLLGVNPEVPQDGSVQSGIGVIRGWACEAERIEIQFNDRPRMQLAYGTSRTDTREVCGDSNNGYGAVYFWGHLGAGLHTMRTYVDDVLIETVDFEVASLNDEFATGLEASYELDDFPEPGQSVTVQWSEADQNFIIVGTEQ